MHDAGSVAKALAMGVVQSGVDDLEAHLPNPLRPTAMELIRAIHALAGPVIHEGCLTDRGTLACLFGAAMALLSADYPDGFTAEVWLAFGPAQEHERLRRAAGSR